jgi:outer membrane lipoprotein-sorting protein
MTKGDKEHCHGEPVEPCGVSSWPPRYPLKSNGIECYFKERYEMKKINPVNLLLIFVVLLPSVVSADNFNQLRKDAANIKTVQSHFTQKKIMKILSKPLVSEGRFYYVTPDSFRWEYTKPLKSIVISHKGEAKRYIMSSGKMVEDKSGGVQAMRIVLAEVANWMSGKFDQNPSFKASVKEGATTEITLIPTGQEMAGMIQKIEISVSKKSMAVKAVKIIENESTATIIDFRDVEINKPVNETVFQDIE